MAASRADTPAPTAQVGSNAHGAASPEVSPFKEFLEKCASRTFLWFGSVLGLASFVVNLVFLLAIGYGACWFQEGWDHEGTLSPEQHEGQYHVLLAASCPRCSLISQKARWNAWPADHPVSGDLSLCYSLPDTCDVVWKVALASRLALYHWGGYWAIFSFAPSVEVILQSWSSNHAMPGGVGLLLFLVACLTHVQDLMYLSLWSCSVLKTKFGHARNFMVAYLLRNLVMWGFTFVFYWMMLLPIFKGSQMACLVASLVSIALLRIASIYYGVCILNNWIIRDSEPDRAHGRWAMWGTLTTLGTIFTEGLTKPYMLIERWSPGATLVGAVFYPSFMWVIGRFMPWVVLLTNVIFIAELVNCAFGNVMLLEALRHKTNPWSYWVIYFQGGRCSMGGNRVGSTPGSGVHDDTRTKFYVFKDTDITGRQGPEAVVQEMGEASSWDTLINQACERWCMPNIHSWLSSKGHLCQTLFQTDPRNLDQKFPWFLARIISFAGTLWGFLCSALPSLKFRCAYHELDSHPFVNDSTYGGFAYWTKNDVPAWWLGVVGTAYHSLKLAVIRGYLHEIFAPEVPWRTQLKVLRGTTQLAIAIAWVMLADIRVSVVSLVFLPWL